MATKKVTASKRVSTKTPTKKRTTRARSSKKATKKVAKKTPTKRVAKKRAPRAKKTTKKAAKKKTTTPAKRPNVSLAVRQLQLAVLSPFRYPINYDAVAARTARYAGVFFVLVGLVSTSLHMHTLSGIAALQHMQANTAGAVATGTEPLPNEGGDETAEYINTAGTEEPLNPHPEAKAKISAKNPISDKVGIGIEVPHATAVTLLLFHIDTQEYITLGTANRDGDAKWHRVWKTKEYPDGKYRLKAIIRNEHGSYDWEDDRILVVENNPYEPDDEDVEIEDNDTADQYEDQEPGINDLEYIEETSDIETGLEHKEEDPVLDVPEEDETDPQPGIELRLPARVVHDGITTLYVGIQDASFVEVYVVRATELQERFLGLAKQQSDHQWKYRIDTTQLPNGTYKLFIKAKTPFGLAESELRKMHIRNSVVQHTTEQTAEIEDMTETHKEVLERIEKTEEATTSTTQDTIKERQPRPHPATTTLPKESLPDADTLKNASATTSEPVKATEESVVIEEEIPADDTPTLDDTEVVETHVSDLIDEVKPTLDRAQNRLARAIRSQDPVKIEVAQNKLQEIKDDLLQTVPEHENIDDFVLQVDAEIEKHIEAVTKRVERNEKIIQDRVGKKAFTDSDKDGITDYDEINIYNTDPFAADSDGDGFNDDVEIEAGFNPSDSTPEALVQYESPKETGIEREDILVVDTVTSIERPHEDTNPTGVPSLALISGKALPNSYVTLYIFSTPIVVTVKTDDDGSWNYRFDKELEDGSHEVFVGITDNAGKIVAKSKPFAFVKTAQAFTPVDAATEATETPAQQTTPVPEQSFLSQHIILLVLSLTVVALGLALLLIGLHMRPEVANPAPAHA